MTTSQDLRDRAARTLRAGRKQAAKSQNRSKGTAYQEIADTYKRLALNQERLQGEPQRSAARPRKP